MLGETVMSYSELVLPYATEDTGRKKSFSNDIEVGALLLLAEAERRKKTGIFRGTVETLAVLSKLHYPMWVVPWEDKCLLIDGMETVSYSLQYFKLPDIEAFVEHLKRSATAQESYRTALRSHKGTFSDFLSATQIVIAGLVTDKELLSDLSAFVKDGRPQTDKLTSLIQPKIDMKEATRIGEKISERHSMLQSEIKGLQFAIDTLDEETKTHIDKLQLELEQVRRKYQEKIAVIKADVAKRTGELEKERDEKVEKMTAINQKEVDVRLEEKKRWEQELMKLEQDKSEYEKRKELRKHKKDEVGEARWDARLREVKNQISTVKGKISALSNFISRSNKETEKTAKNTRDTCQKLIDAEERKIKDIESLRDSEIGEKEKGIQELRQDALTITDKIEQLIDQKKGHASTLKEATVQWRTETPTLVHVPFYLILYETDQEKRRRVRSPAIARDPSGIMMKIRKTLKGYGRQSKISTLLKTRSKALETMLTSFEERVNSDKSLQRSLRQISESNNLLASPDFKEKVRRGVGELEAEGWVKPEEKAAVLEVYAGE
jgi:hypothetical protein